MGFFTEGPWLPNFTMTSYIIVVHCSAAVWKRSILWPVTLVVVVALYPAFPLTGGWRAFEMPFMIVMCPGFHDHYASISAENRELDQESRLSLIGPKIQHKTCSHSIYAWEIRNWHCGACGALGGAFRLSPPGHPVTIELSPKRREATGEPVAG